MRSLHAVQLRELNVTPLIRDELCAIVSKKSVLAKRKQLMVQELSRQPFVMSRYSSERLVQAAYAERRVSPVVRFEVQDLGTLVNMVREGPGISVLPRVVFSDTPPGVLLLPVVPRIRRELGLALKAPEHSPPAVSAFVQSLQELSKTLRLAGLMGSVKVDVVALWPIMDFPPSLRDIDQINSPESLRNVGSRPKRELQKHRLCAMRPACAESRWHLCRSTPGKVELSLPRLR